MHSRCRANSSIPWPSKIPGTRVLDEAFKQTMRAVAVPPNHPLALAFATKFMTEAISNGTLRKALDHSTA